MYFVISREAQKQRKRKALQILIEDISKEDNSTSVTCQLQASKATVTFTFNSDVDTPEDISENLVSLTNCVSHSWLFLSRPIYFTWMHLMSSSILDTIAAQISSWSVYLEFLFVWWKRDKICLPSQPLYYLQWIADHSLCFWYFR